MNKLIKDMTDSEVEEHLKPTLERFGEKMINAFKLVDDIKSEIGKINLCDAKEFLFEIQRFNRDVRKKEDNSVWFVSDLLKELNSLTGEDG